MFLDREGVKWYNLRTVLNKRMLHPKESVQYGDVVNEVVSDLIKRIYHLRRISPSGDLVTNLSNELYRFSLEGTWKSCLCVRGTILSPLFVVHFKLNYKESGIMLNN